MKRLITILAVLAGPGLAQQADIATIRYLCDRGARVEATYVNAGDASFAVVGFEGRQLGFASAVSASGARYVSADPAQVFTWWTKGETAMLLAGPESSESTVYASCVEQH